MKKCKVTLMPEKTSSDYDEGTLLIDILMDQGIPLEAPCGGKGICGKCFIKAEGFLNEKSELEESFVKEPEKRLACQAKVKGDSLLYPSSRSKGYIHFAKTKTATSVSIAVDIGTTSIKIAFIDNDSNSIITDFGFLNPQRIFGHDIISRISAAMNEEKAFKLSHVLSSEIAEIIEEILKNSGISKNSIKKIIFSGNTTMTYFIAGIDTAPLGKHPYETKTLNFDALTENIISKQYPQAEIQALPCASAWLGGDLTGGLAVISEKGIAENIFFIDIGTNGEMFIVNPLGEIHATSCAMGPALEGMNISCGMTAGDGAINHFYYDEKTSDKLTFSVIGDITPTGISGTGLIDLVAILLKTGIVDKSGALKEEKTGMIPSLYFNREKGRLIIHNNIFLSRKDIRSLQLAKGASLAAAKILIEESETPPETIKRVVIAGAFGENLSVKNFRDLSFLPEFTEAEYSFIGNSSLEASVRACTDTSFIQRVKELRDRIIITELSSNKKFNDIFIASLDFDESEN